MANQQGPLPAVVQVNIVPPVPPPVYQFVLGDDNVGEGITEANTLLQILHWIGFRVVAQRASLVEDCFGSFGDLNIRIQAEV